MDLLAITERPSHYVTIQLCMSHDALPAGSPAPAAADVVSSSFSDVLAGPRREARLLHLRRGQSLASTFSLLNLNLPQANVD